MAIVVELPHAQELRLQQEARKYGITADELIRRTLVERFPVEADETARALALIDQWILEAPTDPKGQQEAEEDLREFQAAINQTRRIAGARILYPDSP
jgi:hypothetical protein